MKKLLLFFAFVILISLQTKAQFTTVKPLKPVPVTTNTKDKPQSKVWTYAGRHWTILTDSGGTHLWRLNDQTWQKTLQLSTSTYGKADCKLVGDIAHVLIFKKTKTYLMSLEYDAEQENYKLWSVRAARVPILLDSGAETATIDIDTRGRMWLASDDTTDFGTCNIKVRWSEYPYANWSEPITLANNVHHDDIGAVIAFPQTGQIGVIWSNQNTKRWGFRLHNDSDEPENWSEDEVPSSQSAIDFGEGGMTDDHMNLKVSTDGTLYCAIKTGWDEIGYPRLALLIRRPSGAWDHLYEVSQSGTRPILILQEGTNKMRIVYAARENGGDILYRESLLSEIAFSSPYKLITGKYNYPTSMKQASGSEFVILASDSAHAVGVIVSDQSAASMELKAYPNPFIEEITVDFSIPETTEYSLNLYDFKGAKISVLRQGQATAHELYRVQVPGINLKSGLYAVRLQTSRTTKVLRVIQAK